MASRIKFVLPASFRPFTDGQASVDLSAETVADAVDSLIERCPDLKPHIVDATGKLQPFINLFVDNEQVIALDDESGSLKEGSELLIISALAGG